MAGSGEMDADGGEAPSPESPCESSVTSGPQRGGAGARRGVAAPAELTLATERVLTARPDGFIYVFMVLLSKESKP